MVLSSFEQQVQARRSRSFAWERYLSGVGTANERDLRIIESVG